MFFGLIYRRPIAETVLMLRNIIISKIPNLDKSELEKLKKRVSEISERVDGQLSYITEKAELETKNEAAKKEFEKAADDYQREEMNQLLKKASTPSKKEAKPRLSAISMEDSDDEVKTILNIKIKKIINVPDQEAQVVP